MPTARLVPSAPADPSPAPATIAVVVLPHSPTAVSSGEEGVAGSSGAEPINKKKRSRAAAWQPRGSKTDVDQAKTKKKKHGGGAAPFIDLTGVPPQPLILKNALVRGGKYEDNTRRRPIKAGSSRYTGVYLDNRAICKKKWKAQIMVDGRVRSIGYYESEVDAAGDYARAAFKHKNVAAREATYGGLDLGGVPERPLIAGNGASGYRGVKNMKGRWQARIAVEKGGSRTLGTFDSPEEAASIYARAAFYLRSKEGEYLS